MYCIKLPMLLIYNFVVVDCNDSSEKVRIGFNSIV